MKYYIIAGEASGDLHASNLVKELKKQDAAAVFRGWGGDLMHEQGVEIVKHYRDLAFMGFVEVIANLRTILKNIDYCRQDILQFKPDAVILVDYPGFNLRIAEFLKKQGIKVIYYISPQVWAWKASRVKKIKRDVDLMLVILPFEKEFYKKFDVEVEFVGHPLLDAIAQSKNGSDWKKKNKLSDKPVIAIVPGSRKQEITTMLPLMLSVKKDFSRFQFVIAAAPSVPENFYADLIKDTEVHIVKNQFYDLLKNAEAALVTSGTATLETALHEVPEVVCYKGNTLSYYIARQLVKVKFIALVNLIMDRLVVTELIQNDLNAKNIRNELNRIISDKEARNKMKNDYKELKDKLGNAGASEKAAEKIIRFLKNE